MSVWHPWDYPSHKFRFTSKGSSAGELTNGFMSKWYAESLPWQDELGLWKQTAQVHILPLLHPAVFAALVTEMLPCLYFFIWKMGIIVHIPQRVLRIEWDLSMKYPVVFAHSKSSDYYSNDYQYKSAMQCAVCWALYLILPSEEFSRVHFVILFSWWENWNWASVIWLNP